MIDHNRALVHNTLSSFDLLLGSKLVVHAFISIFYCVREGRNTSFIVSSIRHILMGNVILAFLKDLLIIDFVNEAADVDRVLECLGTIGGFFECALLGTR